MKDIFNNYFKAIKTILSINRISGAVGIDLSAFACHVVDITRGIKGLEVSRSIEVPVENGDEKAALLQAISIGDPALKPKPVVASVGGRGTLVRYIEMPRMPSADLRKAFALEADKYFPFPKDTIYTDCHILDPRGNGKKMSVLVAAAKKEVVDARLRLLRDAGIELSAITLAPVGVANAFEMFPPQVFLKDAGHGPVPGAVAVIDIGEPGTNLMVMSDGLPRFSRDIYIGTGEIVKRASNMTGLSPVAARELLFSAEPKPEPVVRSVEAVMANLASEVMLSFDYFITEKNLPIAQVCLIGEGVAISGLEAAFMAKFEIPAVMWDPLALAGGVTGQGSPADGRKYITALGTALEAYDQD